MSNHTVLPTLCPDHGIPKNRQSCAGCNAAYMRGYLRRRCEEQPDWALWHRAKKRAARKGLTFDLSLTTVVIPDRCPVLGFPMIVGQGRLPQSPSLDRIDPTQGYVTGNCRVISDHANRLKGDLDLDALHERARFGAADFRNDYAKIADYVEREQLLAEVRAKAALGGREAEIWNPIADFLERRFRLGLVF